MEMDGTKQKYDRQVQKLKRRKKEGKVGERERGKKQKWGRRETIDNTTYKLGKFGPGYLTVID